MIRKVAVILFLLSVSSCSQKTGSLEKENKKLAASIDSLERVIKVNSSVPYIDHRDFVGTVGETSTIHFLAIRKGGYIVDSVEVEGYSKDQVKRMTTIYFNEWESYLNFQPDTTGLYRFKAYTRLPNDTHTVLQKYEVEIEKTGPNNG